MAGHHPQPADLDSGESTDSRMMVTESLIAARTFRRIDCVRAVCGDCPTSHSADRASSTHILLLTGPPGIGKTTLVRRVSEGLHETRFTGFTTQEIRAGRQRVGFRLEAFDGRSMILANVDNRSFHRVGKYGVDIAAFDRLVDSVLGRENVSAVYLIDEIGKMECLSSRFVAAVTTILESTAPVIATIAARGDGFI
jgi:nucleoside-triphosphatase